jgi:hypothetical protein
MYFSGSCIGAMRSCDRDEILKPQSARRTAAEDAEKSF